MVRRLTELPSQLAASRRAAAGAPVAASPLSPESQRIYQAKVKPFLEAHCVKCHNDKETRAGFRIDTLGADFLAGKTADHWKEIYDNIGVGKMPPKKEARPDPRQASVVMEWIIQELRPAEKLAKNSSGRIPMRRLNRTEFANSLRDLFYLEVFDQLFRVDDEKTRASRKNELDHTASVLDLVKDQAKSLNQKLGKDDRASLDQYFTSIRDFEERIKIDRNWVDVPPAKVAKPDFGKTPLISMALKNDDGAGMERYLRLMFDVIALAFQTDSTRVVAHYPKGQFEAPTFKDKTKCPFDYHALTHHGEEPEKLRMWSVVDAIYMEHWAYFIGKLKSIKEGNGTLLDHTMAAWATTQGEGGHSEKKLPLMLCGGKALGLKHQGHLPLNDMKLGSVWQTMLDRLGMPLPERFQGGQYDGVIKEVL